MTPISLRLAVRQWLARPLRPILCSLAIAAAVALIVCVGAAFDSLQYSLRTEIGRLLGVADIHVRPAVKDTARLPDSVLQALRKRPEVEFAAGRLESHVALSRDSGERKWYDAVGVDPRYDERLRPKSFLPGGGPLSGAPNEIIIDSGVAADLQANVGDSLAFSADGKQTQTVKVVGIARRPSIDMLSKLTVYLPLDTLTKALGIAPQYNVIDMKLREPGVEDYDAYAAALTKQLGPGVAASAGTNSKARMAKETASIQMILSLLGTVSAICAALIIGTTLSVGVQERVRQFGQLRCIGASRPQLAAFLLGDAAMMLAWGEVLGIILGFALSRLLVWYYPQYFLAYKVTWSSIVIAVVVGAAATVFGAVIPIWQVVRVSPMAAVATVGQPASRRFIWLAAAGGLCCFGLQALLWIVIPSKDAKFLALLLVGVPLIFLGFALLGPALLTICESAGAAVIGRLLAVKPALLRNAWSATPWRSGAMIAALMIGVTLLTSVRAWGQAVVNSWVSPARMPDLLLFSVMDSAMDSLSFIPSSLLPDAETRGQEIKQKYGSEISEFTPVTSYRLKIKTKFSKGGEVKGVDTPHFVAVDPASFPRMVEMEYVQGDRATALKQLAHGGYVFVTKEFSNLRGLGVGDKITFVAANGKPVDFTIAAVVTSTGLELVKNFFDLRAVFQDHALTAFLGSEADARKYFKARAYTIVLANIKPGVAPAAVLKLREELKAEGFPSVSSLELKSAVATIVTRVVETFSIIALGALIVASLGVANMVIASVHARRYEFGVLRAIGAGRGQLIRLVLAEVTLIGGIAGILGAAAGLYMTWRGTVAGKLMTGFQAKIFTGTAWHAAETLGAHFAIAVGITALLAWLASIGPAARGATTAQRTLLAAGRG